MGVKQSLTTVSILSEIKLLHSKNSHKTLTQLYTKHMSELQFKLKKKKIGDLVWISFSITVLRCVVTTSDHILSLAYQILLSVNTVSLKSLVSTKRRFPTWMHWKKSLQGYGLNVKIVKAVCMLMYCVPGVKNTMIDIFWQEIVVFFNRTLHSLLLFPPRNINPLTPRID